MKESFHTFFYFDSKIYVQSLVNATKYLPLRDLLNNNALNFSIHRDKLLHEQKALFINRFNNNSTGIPLPNALSFSGLGTTTSCKGSEISLNGISRFN